MRKRASGFTLIEMLVALLVLGFVVLGLAQGLRLGVRTWDQQAATIARDGARDAINRTLRTLLAGMAPGSDPLEPVIRGSADRLSFIAELPPGAPGVLTGLAAVTLAVDGAHRLVLNWVPHLHARMLAAPAPRTNVLIPGVAELRLAYFRAASGDQPAGWTGQWNGIDPPILVRLHLRFAEPGKHWPDLIVAPMRRRDDE